MKTLKKYIATIKVQNPKFSEDYKKGNEELKIGVILKVAREEAGLTQEQLAQKLKTKKSAISRIEKHAEDIKLSTIERFASALGKKIRIEVA